MASEQDTTDLTMANRLHKGRSVQNMNTRVLLADPDQELLLIVGQMLTQHGFVIATANTGPKTAELLRQFMPVVLVMELDLPDGWSNRLLNMISIGLEVPCVPIIILSRFDGREHHRKLPIVKQYLVKPVSISKLKECICCAT
ncbi:MAG: response regulator receiver protein [Planctomycetaceae bacterium]|nr:response regulator receiver protein [Planctomycetaceae bacterium]